MMTIVACASGREEIDVQEVEMPENVQMIWKKLSKVIAPVSWQYE